jgi:hypothetical protein
MLRQAVILVAVTAEAFTPAWPPKYPMPKQARCPNSQCHVQPPKEKKKTAADGAAKYFGSFLQEGSELWEPNVELPKAPGQERPYKDKVHETDPDSGVSLYNIAFKPGHFMCSKCDTGTCPNCNTMCDLSSCTGEFYTQECWCRKDSQVKLKTPTWWFRQYDSRWLLHDTVRRTHCDDDCTGGICDMPGLQCKRREEACRPWWWCGLNPPTEEMREKTNDDWPTGFEYTESMTFLQEGANKTRAKRLPSLALPPVATPAKTTSFMQRASTEVRRIGSEVVSSTKGDQKFEANDFGLFSFKLGSWECGRAAYPPKIQDAVTYLWNERGYIVFDSPSCKGGEFDTKCYCWDNFEYLKGTDTKTSELHCDGGCGLGPCAGNTCSSSPPPPPTAPPPPPIPDPVEAEAMKSSELRRSNNKMDPLPE